MHCWQRRAVMLAAMLAAGSCGGGGDGPVAPPPGSTPPGSTPPGSFPPPSSTPSSNVVTVSVVTPHTDDAAFLITVVTNQRFDSVVAMNGYEAYTDPDGFTHRVVVMGAIKSGDLFKVYVSNPTGNTPSYYPTLDQIATPAFELRPSPEGYAVSVH